jgi:beta-hydroxylase
MEAALEVMSHPLAIAGLLALVYLACVSYVHFRGKERLKFERQLTEHSGLFSPFNTLIYLCSAVPRDPILPAKDFHSRRGAGAA